MADLRELTWKMNADTGKAAKDIQSVDKELDKVKSSMLGIDKQAGALGKLGGGIASIGGKMQSVGAGMKSVGAGISSVSSNIAKKGAKLTALTAPLALAMKKGVEGALELDTAIRQVSTLADSQILPVSQIESEVRRISDATGIMQTEISQSMYDALSSGIDSADVVSFVEQGVKLTKAGFTDMPTVIDATTTALNAYGLSGQEATAHIQDVFVKTQDLGKITVDELGKNIGRVVPFASAAGVSIDQLGAGYSILTAKGQNAAIATTNLSALISELNTTGSTADKALRESMGQSFKEMMENGASLADVLGSLQGVAEAQGLQLGDMFANKMATSAANTLLADGPDQFNEALNQMANSQGAVDANFEKMMGPAEKLKIAGNQLKNSFIEMGGSLIPILTQVADTVKGVADKFNSLDDGTKETIAKIAGIAVVAGPVLAIIGTIGSVIGGVVSTIGTVVSLVGSATTAIGTAIGAAGGIGTVASTALAAITGPVGIAIAAVVGLGAAAYGVYKNWDTIKEKATEIWGGIKNIVSNVTDAVKTKAGEMATAVSDKFDSLKTAASEKFNAIKETAGNIFSGIGDTIGGTFEGAKGVFDNIKTSIGDKIGSIFNKDQGSNPFESLGAAAESSIGHVGMSAEQIKAQIAGISASGQGHFQTLASGMSNAISEAVTNITGFFNNLLASGQNIATSIGAAFTNFANTMSSVISGAINAVIGMFNNLRAGAGRAINGIIGMWNNLKSVLSAPINAVVNIGKGIASGVGKAIGRVRGHADGLYRVPYDEYPAMLHKDEMVVTAQGSKQLRTMGATEEGFTSMPKGSLASEMAPSTNMITNNNSEANNSSFSPTINVSVNGNESNMSPYLIADVVREELMALFNTATLQRG